MQAEPEQVDAQLHRGRDLVDVLAARSGRGEEGFAERVLRDGNLVRLHRATRRSCREAGRRTSMAALPSRGTIRREAWRQHRTAGQAIDSVADDSAPEGIAGVGTDLVGASRQGTKLDQSGPAANRDPPPVRCRFKAMFVSNHPPAGFGAGTLAERHVDHSLRPRKLGTDHRQIIFLDRAAFESTLEAARALAVRASSRQPLVSVSRRCIGRRRALESARELAQPRRRWNRRRGAACRPAGRPACR